MTFAPAGRLTFRRVFPRLVRLLLTVSAVVLVGFYGAGELVGFDEFRNVRRALDAFVARPAVERGLNIPPR